MSRFLFTGTSCVYTKRCIYIYIYVYIYFFKRSQDVREPWIVDSSLTYSDRWGFVHLEPLENYLQINRCFHYKVFMKKLTRKHMNRNARGPSTSYIRKSKTWQRCRFRVSGLCIYIYEVLSTKMPEEHSVGVELHIEPIQIVGEYHT